MNFKGKSITQKNPDLRINNYIKVKKQASLIEFALWSWGIIDRSLAEGPGVDSCVR